MAVSISNSDHSAIFAKFGAAERTVFQAAPATRAGAVVLPRFAAKFLEDLGINDTMVEDAFPDAIRRAADFFEGRA